MKIVLIGDNQIIKDDLPNNIIDSYWIVDKSGNKIVSIVKEQNNYILLNSNYSKNVEVKNFSIYEENVTNENFNNYIVKNNIILKEYETYYIYVDNKRKLYILQVFPDFEKELLHFDIKDIETITIGKSDKNIIIYDHPLVSDVNIKLNKNNDKWVLTNCNKIYGTFVNNFYVKNRNKNIFNGDIIYIIGLKIIIIGDSIYINIPKEKIKINDKHLVPSEIKNNEINSNYIESYKSEDEKNTNYFLSAPRMIPSIIKETVKIDEPPVLDNTNQKPILLAVGSSMAMGIIMITTLASTIIRNCK